jgi:hypothetical protein
MLLKNQCCQVCLQAKPNRSCYPGKLQPLPVPSEAWETVYMDFIEGLPRSGNDNCVLVVVDKFIRYAHFITLLHPYTASTVDSVFLNRVYKFHGMPASIISNTDPVFTSKFWQSMFKLLGTHLRMSSSYQPQTDGQTKQVNQCLETFLYCFVHACPRSGMLGWLLLSFGTTRATILLYANLHLKPYMVISPVCWALSLLLHTA